MASKPIYQIYAELQDYEPKIWRRFQVMNDITVARLAYILMTLFEMKGSHLYKFEVNELDNYITNHLELDNMVVCLKVKTLFPILIKDIKN